MSSVKRYSMLAIVAIVIAALVLGGFGMRYVKAASTPVVFRVDGNGNITANGTAIRIKGGSWFGLEGRGESSTDQTNPGGAPMEQYIGNVFWNSSTRTYTGDIAEFKAMGINMIRIPIAPQTLAGYPGTGTDPQGMAPYLKNTSSVVIADSVTALKTVLQDLDAAGIYVLLDIHSCSNYVGWRKGRLDARPPYVDAARDNYDFKREDSSCAASNNPSTVTRIQAYDTTKWLADLKTLAGLESAWGLSNIIGIDIYNEPWDYTWADWSALASQAYTTINAVNPNILIFMEGISDTANNQDGTPATITAVPTGAAPSPNWAGNLYEAGANPPAGIPKNMLVYSPHVYGISVFVGKQFVDQSVSACVGLSGDAAGDAKCPLLMPSVATLTPGWDAQFGYLKAQGYAIVIGEFGGNMSWPGGGASLRDINRYSYVTDHTIDAQWQQAFVNYLVSKGIDDTIYWSINPESGDTGGLYTTPYNAVSNTGGWGTWGSKDQTKLDMLAPLWNAPIVTGPTPTPGGPTATLTFTPTSGPSLTPTRTPTSYSGPTVTPTPTGSSNCSSPTVITVPYAKDGIDNVCLQATSLCGYANSWNLTTLDINGTSYLNTYVAGSAIAPVNGVYTIHYVSTVSYGHFEIGGTCSTAPTATYTPVTPVVTATKTSTLVPATVTKTPTAGPATATKTKTPTAGPATATKTPTSVPATATKTATPPSGSCSPVTSTITAPFTYDGAGAFCWQSSNLGGYINSWNTTSVSINGTNETNLYVASGSYPAKINGYWYVSYNSSVAWAHFEAK